MIFYLPHKFASHFSSPLFVRRGRCFDAIFGSNAWFLRDVKTLSISNLGNTGSDLGVASDREFWRLRGGVLCVIHDQEVAAAQLDDTWSNTCDVNVAA